MQMKSVLGIIIIIIIIIMDQKISISFLFPIRDTCDFYFFFDISFVDVLVYILLYFPFFSFVFMIDIQPKRKKTTRGFLRKKKTNIIFLFRLIFLYFSPAATYEFKYMSPRHFPVQNGLSNSG